MIVILFLILSLSGVSGTAFNILAVLAIARQLWKSFQGFTFHVA